MGRYTTEYHDLRAGNRPVYVPNPFPSTYNSGHPETYQYGVQLSYGRRSSSLDCHPDLHSPLFPAAPQTRREAPSSSTDTLNASALPPRTSSRHHSNHRIQARNTSSSCHGSTVPITPTAKPLNRTHPFENPCGPASEPDTSAITSLTFSQFRHGVGLVLYFVAQRMYHMKLCEERNKGSLDLFKVKPPTIEEAARKAEDMGWNLDWEGWKWN